MTLISWSIEIIHNFHISFVQVICLSLFYIICNLFGLCHRYLTDQHQEKTYHNTMLCIEARLRLEREKEQQETLILSVIPAHIGRCLIKHWNIVPERRSFLLIDFCFSSLSAMNMKSEMLRKIRETAKYHHIQSRDYDQQEIITKKCNVRRTTFHDLYIKKHDNVS